MTLQPEVLDPSTALIKTDGDFVDVIHTNQYWSGTPVVCGHVDFFVDMCGADQCNCSSVSSVTQIPNISKYLAFRIFSNQEVLVRP